ncbi:MAG: PilZ domain-containing protein [Nitrospira sp.]|nr:PilZ domain-containing protein [bacterium]MBL7048130.1 PilZ domain-containing protein [Nitrospira sp.]
MERRKSERITVNLKAERISCTKNCSVFIENLSEDGIYMITAPSKNMEYIPGSEISLHLHLGNGNLFDLNCFVSWAYDNAPDDLTNSVGLEILSPPDEYKEFIRTLK